VVEDVLLICEHKDRTEAALVTRGAALSITLISSEKFPARSSGFTKPQHNSDSPPTMTSDTQNSPFIRHLASSGTHNVEHKTLERDANVCDRQESSRPSARLTTNISRRAKHDFRSRPAEAMERPLLLYAHSIRSNDRICRDLQLTLLP
jgi:hypothetical protein